MKCAIVFDSLGPYHLARIAAGAGKLDLVAVSGGQTSAEYQWKPQEDHRFSTCYANPDGTAKSLSTRDFRHRLGKLLEGIRPEVIAVPGWSGRGAFCVMEWAVAHHTPMVLMSESTVWDEPRVSWREAIKTRLVGLASAALVGGEAHADYLRKLGMPPARIFQGYDAVDNAFFETAAAQIRRDHPESSAPWFLASNRFIPKKNLFGLLSAYARYAASVESPWAFCLLGDGLLKGDLLAHGRELGLEMVEGSPWDRPSQDPGPRVFLPGFRQIDDLPKYYAHAGVFVHASTTEQWGLVVNEAMASSLPVLVSERCGCAQELVQQGINGFTFNPDDLEGLAGLLWRMAAPEFPRREYGEASLRIISGWGPERFASGLESACVAASEAGPRRGGLLDRLLLKLLVAR